MKKTYILLASVLTLGLSLFTQAQTRYLDDIGTEVTVESNIVYGNNIGIITQAPVLEELTMDVYQLEGDTTKDKPVVIMLHTGSFLPAVVNGQATGDKSDNAIVEMCNRFAKKGYLAIALNYRLGWNPVSTSEDVRRSTLIQAAYRSLQDVKTAVRFLRMSVAENDNPYGIGDEFAVGGYGTGGYISLSLATLNDYDSELLMPKFIDSSEETVATYGQPMPYIIQSMWGNFEATNYGWHPEYDLNGDGIFEDVPLCVPNHLGYSSEVNMVFNAGGALPDISWLEAGEVPIASMQCIADPDAPFAEGNVIVPTTGEFVITAHGSQMVQEKADTLGNNTIFNELLTTLSDATYSNGNGSTNATNNNYEDLNGLFGIVTPTPSATPTNCGFELEQGAPWDWWDNEWYGGVADAYHGVPSGTMGCLSLLGNPDMSPEKGLAMADMMSDFFTPRVYASLIGTPVPVIYGCTVENSCNYNPEANFNDGSCTSFELELTLSNEDSVFIATTTATNPTYEWDNDGDILENTTNEQVILYSGTYTVTVTDDEGCSLSTSQFIEYVSLNEQDLKQISIYPNPANNFITVSSPIDIAKLKLYSVEGKLLRNYNVNSTEVTLEKDKLSEGLYFIELEINNQLVKKSVIFN